MSPQGTQRYLERGLDGFPLRVRRAVAAAVDLDFAFCVHPAAGALLTELAATVPPGGRIGETGTGTGVGLAWLAEGAPHDATLVSAEIDPDRARAAAEVHADDARTAVHLGSGSDLFDRGPFDLLVLDGGPGAGKDGARPVEPRAVLAPGGRLVIDDFTPTDEWPPMFDGAIDTVQVRWLEHPDLDAEVVVVAPDQAVIVGRLRT